MARARSLRMLFFTGTRAAAAVAALLLAGCASREEKISRGLAEADRLMQAKEPEKAAEVLADLNSRYPGATPLLESLALAKTQAGDHAQAAFFFSEAAESDPEARIFFLFAGEALQQAGDFAGAAGRFAAYLDYFPQDARGWKSLGESEEFRGQPQAAIEAYLQWHKLEPGADAAYRLANLFVQLNNFAQASHWFQTAAGYHGPNENVALLGLLQLQLQANDLVAARRILQELDRKFPGYVDASPFRQARQQVQQWAAAQEEMERALAEQARLARELAEARRAAAERSPPPPPEPAPAPQPAATAAPAPPPPPEPAEEARALRAAGRLEEAVQAYWKALARDDSDPATWADLAAAFQMLGRYAEAEACLLEAMRRDPRSEALRRQHLSLVRDTQPLPAYIRELEAARGQFPGSLDLLLLLGQAYSDEQYDLSRAVARYREFLLLAPLGDPRRSEVEEWLRRQGGR